MTEFEREEAALRAAFDRHADDVSAVPFRTPRRSWRAPLLVAAVVLAVVGAAAGIAQSRDDKTDAPPANVNGLENGQWIGIMNIEVQAPADWAPKYEPGRPDCIRMSTDAPVDPGLARQGYVVIGDPGRAVTAQGCRQEKTEDDPDPAFGQLPFPLWRPYVKLVRARPDLTEQDVSKRGGLAWYRDGTWEFRGWKLTRKTVDEVQVSVLSAPGDDGLGATVLDSARRVTVNHLGCPADSPVLDRPDLDAVPLPDPVDVSGVVICDYVRYYPEGRGLAGSRLMAAGPARDLVRGIKDAPEGPGPDTPETCLHEPAQRALVLRFLGPDGKPVTEAYAYFDSCFRNGIVEPEGTHKLTREDCAPLFTDAPIGLFSGDGVVFPACHTRSTKDELLSGDQLR